MSKRKSNVIDFKEARERKLEEKNSNIATNERESGLGTSVNFDIEQIRRELLEHLSPEALGQVPQSKSNIVSVDQTQSGTHETVGSLYRLFDVLEAMGALRRKPGVTDSAIHKLCAKFELIQKITLEEPHKT